MTSDLTSLPTAGGAIPPVPPAFLARDEPLSEYELQCAIADFLDWALPPEIVWSHLPFGELRDKATAAKLKRMGVRAGWPDFAIVWDPMIFIELKAGRNTLSPAQRRFKIEAIGRGHRWYEARSVDEVIAALDVNNVPMRARVTA